MWAWETSAAVVADESSFFPIADCNLSTNSSLVVAENAIRCLKLVRRVCSVHANLERSILSSRSTNLESDAIAASREVLELADRTNGPQQSEIESFTAHALSLSQFSIII